MKKFPSSSSAIHRKTGGIGLLAIAVLFLGGLAEIQAQTNYQRLKSFGFPTISTGAGPFDRMIQGTNGFFYGTTYSGGSNQHGVVFQLKRTGSYTVLHQFNGQDGSGPQAELLQASDGALYGTTSGGGANGLGTVIKLNLDGSGFVVLHSFSAADGIKPNGGLLEGREDGMLYGTTSTGGPINTNGGTAFSVNKNGSGFAVLCNFDGNAGGEPNQGLVEGVDGALYGTTAAGGSYLRGTIFRIQRNGAGQTVLYNFRGTNGDGGDPIGRLMQGSDGALYGTTEYGGFQGTGVLGRLGNGTIYKIGTNGSGYQRLHSFATSGNEGYFPQAGLTQGSDGLLYGVAFQGGTNSRGTVFKLSTSGTSFSVLYHFGSGAGDGTNPEGLIQGNDSLLYGMTVNGGIQGAGTAFRLNTNGLGENIFHQFINPDGGDGINPQATLAMDSSGTWYGTTPGGGSNGSGTVFKMNQSGSGYMILYSFGATNGDGTNPQGGVVRGRDGFLYGTTYYGGTNGQGAVFRIGTNGGSYQILRHFGRTNDGNNPAAGLVQGSDGYLYGTTVQGGASGQGTVFKLSTSGSGYTNLYSFAGSPTDGANPEAGVLQGADARLYGTTAQGGANYEGTVFTMDTNGCSYSTLYHFNNVPGDGSQPEAGLMQGSNGMLFGTTYYGGTNGQGTIFTLNTNGNGYAVLYHFGNVPGDGINPQGLSMDGGGNLYGATYWGGTNGFGAVFKLATNGYTVLYNFTGGADGANPQAGLTLGMGGSLFGTASRGGDMGYGAIFQLSVGGVSITNIQFGAGGVLLSMSGGIPAQSYDIQAATNLIMSPAWHVIGSNSAASDGTFQFLDTNASLYRTRYYRSATP